MLSDSGFALMDRSLLPKVLRPGMILRRKHQPTRSLADKQEATIMEAVLGDDKLGSC